MLLSVLHMYPHDLIRQPEDTTGLTNLIGIPLRFYNQKIRKIAWNNKKGGPRVKSH